VVPLDYLLISWKLLFFYVLPHFSDSLHDKTYVPIVLNTVWM